MIEILVTKSTFNGLYLCYNLLSWPYVVFSVNDKFMSEVYIPISVAFKAWTFYEVFSFNRVFFALMLESKA